MIHIFTALLFFEQVFIFTSCFLLVGVAKRCCLNDVLDALNKFAVELLFLFTK